MSHRWLWRARVVRVIDGDTLDLEIDCGFHAVRTERVRLLGVNAPEMKGDTKTAGVEAKRTVMAWCDQLELFCGEGEWPYLAETFKADAFGRYLARIWPADASPDDTFADLSSHLLSTGHAVPYERSK